MSFIYLGSPYHHKNPAIMHMRYRYVSRATAKLINSGLCVYSPIAHNHPLALDYNLPREFAFWQKFDFAMLEASETFMILKLEGWEESKGLEAEIGFATRNAIKIEFLDWPLA